MCDILLPYVAKSTLMYHRELTAGIFGLVKRLVKQQYSSVGNSSHLNVSVPVQTPLHELLNSYYKTITDDYN